MNKNSSRLPWDPDKQTIADLWETLDTIAEGLPEDVALTDYLDFSSLPVASDYRGLLPEINTLELWAIDYQGNAWVGDGSGECRDHMPINQWIEEYS